MPRRYDNEKPHRSLGLDFYRTSQTGHDSAHYGLPDLDLTHRKKAQPGRLTPQQAQTEQAKIDAVAGMDCIDNIWQLTPLEESFRHGHWASRRARVQMALIEAKVPEKQIWQFANCGAAATVWIDAKDGTLQVRAQQCKHRFCQACGTQRAQKLQRALAVRVPQHKTLHVVLTMKSNTLSIGDQIDKLYKAGSKLRAGKKWKRWVLGGMASLELTFNEQTGLAHPHLHLLVHADWIPQNELSKEWLRVTGDSAIVHVSLVEKTAAAIREVTKYVTKPVHRSIDFRPEILQALITALAGRHMMVTFGTWRKDPLLKNDPAEEQREWKRWGTLIALHAAAARQDTWAMQALAHLASQKPGRERVPPPALESGP